MELFQIHNQKIVSYTTELKSLPKTGYMWLLLERSEPFDLNAWLKNLGVELNPRHLEDIAQINHPSSYEGAGNEYEMVIFRSLSERKDSGHRRLFDSTTFVIFKNLLVTVYDHQHKEVSNFLSILASEKGGALSSPNILVEFCLDRFVSQVFDIKQMLDGKLTMWQKKLLQTRGRSQQDWMGLLDFKTDVRRIKMLCEEQLDTINAWHASLRVAVKEKPKPYVEQLMINLNDLAEHANRMVKLATQSQQELDSLLQLHFTILSHRTNEIMRIVALVTGIFLPANLITGIFGMNFTNIPDLRSPHGFISAIGTMLLISVVLLSFFRWRKWL